MALPGIHLCNKHLLLQIFGPSCCLMPNLRRLWFTCMKGSVVFWCVADRCTASALRLPLRLDNGRVTARLARRRSYMCIAVVSLCPLQVPKRALAQHRAHASSRSANIVAPMASVRLCHCELQRAPRHRVLHAEEPREGCGWYTQAAGRSCNGRRQARACLEVPPQ